MATTRQKVMVKIKKGQSYILPGDAKIISLTEVDGASAESLCAEFPPSTPLVNYTFFVEKRVFRAHTFDQNSLDLYVTGFGFGEDETTDFTDGGKSQGYYLEGVVQVFPQALKRVPGIVALYMCFDNCDDNNNECNITITVTVPESYGIPWMEINVQEAASDPWFARLYPIDPNQLGQVERPECTNRV